jgi:hypothetical protein
MPEFIYGFSSIQLYVFLNVVLFITSVTFTWLVRRRIPLDFRYQENTAIVSCSALLGIIYAVLIGFTILYQFGAFDKLEKEENQEGVSLYNIYENALSLPDTTATQIRSLVIDYAKNAVNYEWPALNDGTKINKNGKTFLNKIKDKIHDLDAATVTSLKTTSAINAISEDLGALYKLHHERTATVHTTLNGHIWFVLVLATFFTLGVNFLLGMEFRLHIFCLTLISVIMSSVIYLLVGLDRPYQGDFVVHPVTIETLLEDNTT